MNSQMKLVKELGWDTIAMKTGSFGGAAKVYTAEDGEKVAVMFTLTSAYVIEDSDGLFGLSDLTGIIKGKEFDATNPDDLAGARVFADSSIEDEDGLQCFEFGFRESGDWKTSADSDKVAVDQEEVDALNLSDEDLSDITNRLVELNKLAGFDYKKQ